MSREFPHLNKANAWPGLRTVDPFDLQVTFDPYLWTPDVTIHLCSTPLDPAYEHIGGWATAHDRDVWFDSMSDLELTLDTELHVLPGVEIKLPYAFEVLQRYNQLYIDFPPTPTADGSTESHRYYYFLSDVQYRSPSATACVIMLDEWSTHMFDLDMKFIELERGHAPMAATSVEEYLRNPIANCKNLTVPDNAYGRGQKVAFTARHVLNAGPHWLIVNMTSDPAQSPGTIYDEDTWRTPATIGNQVQGAFCTPSVFAISPSSAVSFFNAMNSTAPQLLPTVQSVFLVPQRLVTTGTAFTFLGTTCYGITPVQKIEDFLTLNKQLFRYPNEYADIAKLYTSPYAWIELVDENGNGQRIAVEDTTGRLRLSTIASILAPFIGIDMQVIGIGGDDESQVTWDNLQAHTVKQYGDWTASLRHWNIPTYAVMQDAETVFNWTNYWSRKQADDTNDAGYDLAIDNNNLNYSLRNAALDRQTARIGEQQAHDNAQVAQSQETSTYINAANLAKLWDDETQDQNFMEASSNLTASEIGMSWSTAQAQSSNQLDQLRTSVGQAHQYSDFVNTMGVTSNARSVIDFGANVVSSVNSSVGVPGISQGLAGMGRTDLAEQAFGVGMGANLMSTGLGLISDGIGVYQTFQQNEFNSVSAAAASQQAQLQLQGAGVAAQNMNATYALMMANNQILRNTTRNYMINKTNNAVGQANEVLRLQKNQQTQATAIQHQYQNTINAGDVALTRAQIGSTKGMSDYAAGVKKSLQDESLDNAWRTGRLGTPTVVAQPTGSAGNYTRPQMVVAYIKTQDAGAIAAAGDAFLRYGYRMAGRQWSLSNLTPMSTFTYWEGRVRLGTGHVNAVTRDIISQIFANGTTVWKDPAKIGSTSIYENRGR